MRYKSIDTGEIVKVVQENDSFYTLNNGMKIAKKLFNSKFSIINESVVTENTVDAESFLNTPTNIQVKVPNTATQQNQQYTVTNQAQEEIESIDPGAFFSSSKLNIQGVDGLKNIDTSKIVDAPKEMSRQVKDVTNEAIKPMTTNINLEEQKRQLLETYNKTHSNNVSGLGSKSIDENDENAVDNMLKTQQPVKPEQPLNENGLTEFQENFRKQQIELSGVDPYADKIKKYREQQRTNAIYNIPLNTPSNNQVNEQVKQSTEKVSSTPVDDFDDSYKIFKTFKRNYDIVINLKVDGKISKPDFIKIMSDGIDGDIIKYYSEEILKSILSDIPTIQKKIYDQIYKEVYGDEKKNDDKSDIKSDNEEKENNK